MARRCRRADAEVRERPITLGAADNLGAFELAELWSDRSAWPVSERTQDDELACRAALAKWLERWLPVAIHGAMIAGAKPEAVAGRAV
jgi:imidazolonepropionase-like amidohydrolase